MNAAHIKLDDLRADVEEYAWNMIDKLEELRTEVYDLEGELEDAHSTIIVMQDEIYDLEAQLAKTTYEWKSDVKDLEEEIYDLRSRISHHAG